MNHDKYKRSIFTLFLLIAFAVVVISAVRIFYSTSRQKNDMSYKSQQGNVLVSVGKNNDTYANKKEDLAYKGNPFSTRQTIFDTGVSLKRQRLDLHYATLITQLELSKEEIEIFKDLLIDFQHASHSLSLFEMANDGQARNSETHRDNMRRIKEDIKNNLFTLLGKERYNQFEYYEKTLPQRELVEVIGLRFSYETDPLSVDQEDLLIDIFHKNMIISKNIFYTKNKTNRIDKNKIISQAAEYLSSSQLISLKKYLNELNY
jgi:hypothetical protein